MPAQHEINTKSVRISSPLDYPYYPILGVFLQEIQTLHTKSVLFLVFNRPLLECISLIYLYPKSWFPLNFSMLR